MSVVQVLLLAAMAAGAVLAVIRRSPVLGAAVVACTTLPLVVTIIAWGHSRQDHVRTMDGRTIELTSGEGRGRELFGAHCSQCHTLRAVDAAGVVGPNLDFVRPTAAVVRRRVHEGSRALTAVMPPDIVTGSDAADVADFVARVAGR